MYQPRGVLQLYVGLAHFWIQVFEFQYCLFYFFIYFFFFWGGGRSEKINHFRGYEDFVDIFGGHHKTGLVLGVMSMYFMVFS